MTENKMQAMKFVKYGISITLTLSSAEEGKYSPDLRAPRSVEKIPTTKKSQQ